MELFVEIQNKKHLEILCDVVTKWNASLLFVTKRFWKGKQYLDCTPQHLSIKSNMLKQINLDMKWCCSEWQKKR